MERTEKRIVRIEPTGNVEKRGNKWFGQITYVLDDGTTATGNIGPSSTKKYIVERSTARDVTDMTALFSDGRYTGTRTSIRLFGGVS